MLILGSKLLSTPIMSLQTGGQLGTVEKPVIDPAQLKVLAYEITGPLLDERPALLLTADIREYGHLGMIIESNDEIIGVHDVIKIEAIYDLNFNLIGMPVIDEQKRKLGKVEDYSLETGSFVIQQLNVKRGLLRSLTDTGLLIHRAQIVEINNQAIVVKSNAEKSVAPVMSALRTDYVNPFRSATPKTEG